MAPDHIESFHRTLDFVARERRYLSFLEAPPIELTRAYEQAVVRVYAEVPAVEEGVDI